MFGCSNVLFTVVLIDGWIIIYDCTVRYDTCRSEQERREFILVCVLGSSSEFDEGVVRQKNRQPSYGGGGFQHFNSLF